VVRAFIGLALAIVTSPVVLDGQCEDDGWKAWHGICIELTEPALGERTLTLAVTGRPSQAQTFGVAAFYYLPASICLQVNHLNHSHHSLVCSETSSRPSAQLEEEAAPAPML
jgi:hypothetical protein